MVLMISRNDAFRRPVTENVSQTFFRHIWSSLLDTGPFRIYWLVHMELFINWGYGLVFFQHLKRIEAMEIVQKALSIIQIFWPISHCPPKTRCSSTILGYWSSTKERASCQIYIIPKCGHTLAKLFILLDLNIVQGICRVKLWTSLIQTFLIW